jgi:hypothetical protein
MIFSIKFLQVFGKMKGAAAAIPNFGSGSGRQFNFGPSALGSGFTTLADRSTVTDLYKLVLLPAKQDMYVYEDEK